MKNKIAEEILRGSYTENYNYAKVLSETLGNSHVKTQAQWVVVNCISDQLRKLNDDQDVQECDATGGDKDSQPLTTK